MSQRCPLCGRNKIEDALFCEECTKKLRSDYEVELPENGTGEIPRVEGTASQEENEFTDHPEAATELPENKKPPGDDPATDEEADKAAAVANSEPIAGYYYPEEKKKRGALLWIVLALLLLAGAFFIYKTTIENGHLDRSSWEAAVKINSVEGYLDYMEAHPRGAFFDAATIALQQLKSDEAEQWELLKTTDRITELRDFLERNRGSYYAPLVRRRLDSLSWMGALNSNSEASYSDYIRMVERGEFSGEYLSRAEERFNMLHQTTPVDVVTLDSIRSSVNGFFYALSQSDHNGLHRYLAPVVDRFFDSGRATRDRMTGTWIISAAKREGEAIRYQPELESIQYVNDDDGYRVNVPLLKSFQREGVTHHLSGYIAHLELNAHFRITAIYEMEPPIPVEPEQRSPSHNR